MTERHRGRGIGLDLEPLKTLPYRWLWSGFMVSFFGSQITVVAVKLQVYRQTGSSAMVGAIAAAEIVPLILLSVVGGAVADAFDRRKVLWFCDSAQLVCSAMLALNAFQPHPQLWVVYVLAALMMGLSSIAAPARWSISPRLLPERLYPASAALESVGWNMGALAGPPLGGLLVVTLGLPTTYLIQLATVVFSLFSLLRLGAIPPGASAPSPSWRAIADGFRYLKGRHVLQGTYLIDFNAMIFGMPAALFPAIATARYGEGTVGLLMAAPAVGALLGTATSGWTGRIHRHGRAIVIAVAVWGAAIAVFGFAKPLWLALVMLAVAGWADLVSVVFRKTIWAAEIEEEFRGRLNGIAWANVRGGVLLGDIEAGTMASLTSTTFSVVSGGLLCVAGAGVLALLLPGFVRYDARRRRSAAMPSGTPQPEAVDAHANPDVQPRL